jgi:hypothetical protein
VPVDEHCDDSLPPGLGEVLHAIVDVECVLFVADFSLDLGNETVGGCDELGGVLFFVLGVEAALEELLDV